MKKVNKKATWEYHKAPTIVPIIVFIILIALMIVVSGAIAQYGFGLQVL